MRTLLTKLYGLRFAKRELMAYFRSINAPSRSPAMLPPRAPPLSTSVFCCIGRPLIPSALTSKPPQSWWVERSLKCLFWRLPRRVFERQTIVERVRQPRVGRLARQGKRIQPSARIPAIERLPNQCGRPPLDNHGSGPLTDHTFAPRRVLSPERFCKKETRTTKPREAAREGQPLPSSPSRPICLTYI